MTYDPLDCPFHAAALQAFLEVARASGTWPESEAVRRRAYQLYEQELRERNAKTAD